MPTNTVKITLEAEDKTKGVFDGMKKGPEATKGPLDSLGGSWVGLTAKITAATAVVYGVSRAFSEFISDAAEAESIERRLQFAIEGANYSWGTAKIAVDSFAKSVMDSTRFSDEQARQALTDMMMYTNEYAKAETGARLAMDMSIRTGHDLTSSTRLIGMALTGNVEMLGRYLPELRNLDAVLGADASMAEKAAYALKVLQDKFGGTAAADLETYSGKLSQFKNQWGEFGEKLGSAVLPPLTKILETLTDIMKNINAPPAQASAERYWRERIGRSGGGLVGKLWGAAGGEPVSLYPTEPERRFMGWGAMGGGKKDVFREDYSEIIKKSADESAKSWGEYAQAELDALEKMFKDQAEDRIAIEKYTTEKILAGEQEFENDKREAIEAVYKVQNELDMEWVANHELANQRILEGEQEFANMKIEAQNAVYQAQIDQWEEEAKKSDQLIQSFSGGLSSAWSTNLTSMIKGTENFSDAVKNIFAGMGDAVINTITKMATNWLMFGSLTGEKGGTSFFGSSKGGYGGLIGGIFGLLGMAEGGEFWVNRPTPILVGEGGQREFVSVTPESKMGKGQGEGDGITQIINYVTVTDPNTFVRTYGPVVKKLSGQAAAEAKRYNRSQ
jgi:hypothetical protein